MKKVWHMLLLTLVLTVSLVSLSSCQQNTEQVVSEQTGQTNEQKENEIEQNKVEKDIKQEHTQEENGKEENSEQQNLNGENTEQENTDLSKVENTQENKEDEEKLEAPNSYVVTNEAAIMGMAADILENMTLKEKIGQLFMVNLELLDNSEGDYYDHKKLTKEMKKALKKYHVGGVIFFARNISTTKQTTTLIEKLQANSKVPLFISVDEEGGEVARIANNDNMRTTKFPTMEEVGEMADKDYAYNMGETIGKEIKQLGFNLNFAPVADVKTNELNTEIGNRSFGDDERLVSEMVVEVVKGLQDQGVSATLKHFPGHGDASDDSHEGAVNVENDINRLRKIELVPFKAGIKAGADLIMVSHISISRVTGTTEPASLSSLVMKDMLRTEMGFDGVIITDAMNMKAITDYCDVKEAAVTCILSGADICLMPQDLGVAYKAVLEAVENGVITEKRIDESVTRILELKIKRGIILSDTDLIPEKEIVTKEDEIPEEENSLESKGSEQEKDLKEENSKEEAVSEKEKVLEEEIISEKKDD